MGAVSVVSFPDYRYWSDLEAITISACGKDHMRAKMEQEQSKRDCTKERKWKQRDTTSEESKAKEKEEEVMYTGRV